ncbi:hypothetical protein AVEN_250987-1 [Araneus ventricosus]|uniref:Uncharacterized protein n=1 Tax=Araneus ventricosus TaxID=182803 RepID=A0A4Y2K522_ARAVE|nr:hypothetical protein AVEN_250987-1 [Araneus ventricosus]
MKSNEKASKRSIERKSLTPSFANERACLIRPNERAYSFVVPFVRERLETNGSKWRTNNFESNLSTEQAFPSLHRMRDDISSGGGIPGKHHRFPVDIDLVAKETRPLTNSSMCEL